VGEVILCISYQLGCRPFGNLAS